VIRKKGNSSERREKKESESGRESCKRFLCRAGYKFWGRRLTKRTSKTGLSDLKKGGTGGNIVAPEVGERHHSRTHSESSRQRKKEKSGKSKGWGEDRLADGYSKDCAELVVSR